MVTYDLNKTINKYEEVVGMCNDEELKSVIAMCKRLHDYFEMHFSDFSSSEKAHYHLHLAQEAISEYIMDKEEFAN